MTEEKKNLAILFCSFRPGQMTEEVQNGRELEYLMCLRHLLRVIPLDRFDVYVAENTVKHVDNIRSAELRDLLVSDPNLKEIFLFEENYGEKGNKGMGELQMLKGVMDSLEPDQFKNVSYVTARRIFANPYVFERTDSMKFDALVSNPDLMYVTGKYSPANTEKLFNDMFFSMTQKAMKEYADFSMENIQYNLKNVVGSEQNLYRFVTEKNLKYEFLKWLGVIRNDWMLDCKQANIENIHVC